ncbi:hypothetical protein TREES_T100001871 [Tupaia chinensis]|uniref:Uncharacterized protein n=1 Tax=Tupaia chinensis TaxID=246437 RepID=L9K443_TUPCH|nr:hypothetical protein TREES_T100001871 [Tupaia chinensis]
MWGISESVKLGSQPNPISFQHQTVLKKIVGLGHFTNACRDGGGTFQNAGPCWMGSLWPMSPKSTGVAPQRGLPEAATCREVLASVLSKAGRVPLLPSGREDQSGCCWDSFQGASHGGHLSSHASVICPARAANKHRHSERIRAADDRDSDDQLSVLSKQQALQSTDVDWK